MSQSTQPNPPSKLEDLERVIDLFYYERAAEGDEKRQPGGAGAYVYYGVPELSQVAGTEIQPWVDDLKAHISTTEPSREDFRVQFRGTQWRVCRDVANDSTQVQLRKLPGETPLLNELRMECPAIRDLMLAPWLNQGGLVLLAGLTGQGKSTIAAATARTRLEKYGGRCVVIEDVAELPLEGVVGKGSCRQIIVDYDTLEVRRHGFAGAVRRAYRSFPATRPAILYVGEVRDGETAQEVVKAAANGMLVITTIHAYDPTTALMRLTSLAEGAMGDSAALSIAQALRMVIHHSLILQPNKAGWSRGSFQGAAMISDGPSHPLANLIRKGEWQQMGSIQRMHQTKLDLASKSGTPAMTLLQELGSMTG